VTRQRLGGGGAQAPTTPDAPAADVRYRRVASLFRRLDEHGLFAYEAYLERLVARGDLDMAVDASGAAAQTEGAAPSPSPHAMYMRVFAAGPVKSAHAANLRRRLVAAQQSAVAAVRPPSTQVVKGGPVSLPLLTVWASGFRGIRHRTRRTTNACSA